MTETIPEVLLAMRAKLESMKPGGMRNILKQWLNRLEAASSAGPFPIAQRTGIFDNRRTNQREKWEHGRLGPTQPAERCPPSHPFGTYPDVTPAAGSAE